MTVRADMDPSVEVPEMSPVLAEALNALGADIAGDVPALRERVLSRSNRLRLALLSTEALLEAGQVAAKAAAEVWAWVAYLVVIRGLEGRTTVALYAMVARRYLAWCAENGVDYTAATVEQMESWQRWNYLAKRCGASVRGRQVSVVRQFYAWRQAHGLGANCAARLRLPKDQRRMPKKYTGEQLRAILRAARGHHAPEMEARNLALLLLLVAAGLRREELCRIDVGDVEMGQRVGAVLVHGKGSRERTVPIEGPVVEALRAWMLARSELPGLRDSALFVTFESIPTRMRVRGIERVVAVAAKRAGLSNWGVHRFRVTFATALYDQGAGIEEIRILLGHNSIETTRRYLAVSDKARRTRLKSSYQNGLLGNASGAPSWIGNVIGGEHALE